MAEIKIATWNVNSIRARSARVLAWMEANSPDVLCLQETKSTDETFPDEGFRALGYEVAHFGQRTYNGVAIVSRQPLRDVERGFADGSQDEAARFIAGRVCGIRVASAYIPNGKAVGTDKFAYKLEWLERLKGWLERCAEPQEPIALCGDYNVAPTDDDVYDAEAFRNQVLCHPEERSRFEALLKWGFVDTFGAQHPEGGYFSWWDYRQLGFPKNRGVRIDHILASAPLASRVDEVYVDRAARKGKEPSDHAPVVAVLL